MEENLIKFFHLNFKITEQNKLKKIVVCQFDNYYTITYHKLNIHKSLYPVTRKYSINTLFSTLYQLRKDKNFISMEEY